MSLGLLQGFSIDDTLGAAFIGFAVSCAAFGVNTNQVVTYFARYPEDRGAYKLLVVAIWILGFIDQAFIGHAVYFYTITNYVNPFILLDRVIWTLIVQLTIGALIGTIVRLCFAMRVWRFSQRNVIVTAMIIALTLAELGLAIAFTVKCFQNPYLTILPNLKVLASLALGAGALTDVVIAVSLCFFLRRYRTGSKRADSLVTSLTVYAVNTGAFTAAISICTLVFYDLRPTNFQFLAFYFILSKLYAISFLCTLNTRRIIRGKGTERSDGRSDGHTNGLSGQGSHSRFYAGHGIRRSVNGTHPFDPTTNGGTSYSAKEMLSMGSSKGMEIGVHQEVSVASDADGQFEMESQVNGSSGTYGDGGYKGAYAYAYSPPVQPAYVYTGSYAGRELTSPVSVSSHGSPSSDKAHSEYGWAGSGERQPRLYLR